VRVVDALVAWGDEGAVSAAVDAQLKAGADHVCVQVVTDDPRAAQRRVGRLADVARRFNTGVS
jgi:hypothetical protein